MKISASDSNSDTRLIFDEIGENDDSWGTRIEDTLDKFLRVVKAAFPRVSYKRLSISIDGGELSVEKLNKYGETDPRGCPRRKAAAKKARKSSR